MQPDEKVPTVTVQVTPAQAELLATVRLIGADGLHQTLSAVLSSAMISFQEPEGEGGRPTNRTLDYWCVTLQFMDALVALLAEKNNLHGTA